MIGIASGVWLRRLFLSAIGFVRLFAAAVVVQGADDKEDEDLGLPGLAFVLESGAADLPATDVARRLAFDLQPRESFAPRQSPEALAARWSGRVQVLRPGKYVFRAEVVGRFTLRVADREVLRGAGSGDGASIVGEPIELKYGQIPLEATYAKVEPASAARLRVFWRREGEGEAPVSAMALNRASPAATTSVDDATALRAAVERVVDLRCTACHRSPEARSDGPPTTFEGLPVDRAPDLEGIGLRVHEAWLHRWLDAPHAWRKNATMPDLFGDGPREQVDLYAAVKFLASLRSAPKRTGASAEDRGIAEASAAAIPSDVNLAATRRSMAAVGCIACHRLPEEEVGAFGHLRPLDDLGDKFVPEALRRRIAEPRAHFADSRMPDFHLATEQPRLLDDITSYLLSRVSPAAPPLPQAPVGGELERRWNELFEDDADRRRFEQLPEHERWIVLGRRVVESRGCVNCHPLPGLTSRSIASPWPTRGLRVEGSTSDYAGCLADRPSPKAADYRWTAKGDAATVRRGLERLVRRKDEPFHPAPLFAAADQLRRNGCSNCHDHGRDAGAFSQRILKFAPLVGDQVLHDVAPPNLSGIGEKLLAKTLVDVIDGKTRARPWMALRMPTFKPEHVAGLAHSLAATDGVPIDDRRESTTAGGVSSAASASAEQLEIGRQLMGRTGLNCVSCHDIRGVKSIGVRGPDLANVPRRVRHEWFEQWLLDPQRLAPGTRMPTVFFGGKSAAPQFYDGDPRRQLDALWAYLSQGNRLELPSLAPPAGAVVAGGENPRYAPTDRPLVVRGFMPGTAGLRGLAVGTPQRLHFAFDTERCTLAAAWHGDFAEVGGWYDNGRGSAAENAVKPLGKIIWRGVEGPQWSAAPESDDARVDLGRPLVPRFEAVWAFDDPKLFRPGVRYSFDVRPGEKVTVTETWQPAAAAGSLVFTRRLRLEGNAALPGLRLLICEHAVDIGDAAVEYETAGVRWRVTLRGGPGANLGRDATGRTFATIERTAPDRPIDFSFDYQPVVPPK